MVLSIQDININKQRRKNAGYNKGNVYTEEARRFAMSTFTRQQWQPASQKRELAGCSANANTPLQRFQPKPGCLL
jgi:hypothetical protein